MIPFLKPIRREKLRVLVVDDHAMMRVGLMTAANDQPDMEVVADVDSGEEAIEACRQHAPDVVVLDLRMHGMGGLETVRVLRAQFPDVRVLIFSNYAGGEEVYQAMKSGARGFVVKDISISRMLEAIRTVGRGEQYIPPEIAMRMGERLMAQLSPRELDVLRQLAKGLSNKGIAAELTLAEGTVKIHITNLLAKLGVCDRTQAVVVAVKRGIIEIE